MEEFDFERELIKLYKEIENDLIASTEETKILTPDGARRVHEVFGRLSDILGEGNFNFKIRKPRPLETHAAAIVLCKAFHVNYPQRDAFLDLLELISSIGVTRHTDGRFKLDLNIPDVYASLYVKKEADD